MSYEDVSCDDGGELLEPRLVVDFLGALHSNESKASDFRIEGEATDDCYYDRDGNRIEFEMLNLTVHGIEQPMHRDTLTINVLSDKVEGVYKNDEKLGVLCEMQRSMETEIQVL